MEILNTGCSFLLWKIICFYGQAIFRDNISGNKNLNIWKFHLASPLKFFEIEELMKIKIYSQACIHKGLCGLKILASERDSLLLKQHMEAKPGEIPEIKLRNTLTFQLVSPVDRFQTGNFVKMLMCTQHCVQNCTPSRKIITSKLHISLWKNTESQGPEKFPPKKLRKMHDFDMVSPVDIFQTENFVKMLMRTQHFAQKL